MICSRVSVAKLFWSPSKAKHVHPCVNDQQVSEETLQPVPTNPIQPHRSFQLLKSLFLSRNAYCSSVTISLMRPGIPNWSFSNKTLCLSVGKAVRKCSGYKSGYIFFFLPRKKNTCLYTKIVLTGHLPFLAPLVCFNSISGMKMTAGENSCFLCTHTKGMETCSINACPS